MEVHHEVGFIDAMAPSEVSLATGIGQWAAGRRVSLGAALAERFPLMLGKVLAGEVCTGTVQRVVSACEGLDKAACAKVDAIMAGKVADLDPGRVASFTRRVATRVASDQVRAAHRRTARDRFVETRPGPDGATWWSALLPAATSAAAWSAITTLGAQYAVKDEALSADQARADAFMDLLLRNVSVSAKVTLGIPVITDTTPPNTAPPNTAPPNTAPPNTAREDTASGTATNTGSASTGDAAPDVAPHTASDAAAGEPASDGAPAASDGAPGVAAMTPSAHVRDADMRDADVRDADVRDADMRDAPGVGGQGLGEAFRISTVFSGCEIPGIGVIDADTIEALLQTVPLQVGRALLDARTGTVLETTTTAYRPTKCITDFVSTRDGTCRMWGCDRPSRACDLDHVRPWPAGATTPGNLGGLCRRHHRLKQRGRWRYTLHPDGTVEWVSPSGKTRVTHADHTIWPPPTPPQTPSATSPTSPPPTPSPTSPAPGKAATAEPLAAAPPADDWGPPPF